MDDVLSQRLLSKVIDNISVLSNEAYSERIATLGYSEEEFEAARECRLEENRKRLAFLKESMNRG